MRMIKNSLLTAGILVLIVNTCAAATIDCYSNGKRIYHGASEEIMVDEDYLVVSYKRYSDVIYAKNCIITEVIKPHRKRRQG